jgi:hypothetical protein
MSVPERRVVAVRPVEVAGHTHIAAVKLADDTIEDAATVIAAIRAHEAHYTMIPPPGAPAYEAHVETGLPLELQIRPCPDCTAETLFA